MAGARTASAKSIDTGIKEDMMSNQYDLSQFSARMREEIEDFKRRYEQVPAIVDTYFALYEKYIQLIKDAIATQIPELIFLLLEKAPALDQTDVDEINQLLTQHNIPLQGEFVNAVGIQGNKTPVDSQRPHRQRRSKQEAPATPSREPKQRTIGVHRLVRRIFLYTFGEGKYYPGEKLDSVLLAVFGTDWRDVPIHLPNGSIKPLGEDITSERSIIKAGMARAYHAMKQYKEEVEHPEMIPETTLHQNLFRLYQSIRFAETEPAIFRSLVHWL